MIALASGGCASSRSTASVAGGGGAFSGLPPDERPVPAGRGPAFTLPSVSGPAERAAAVAGLRCTNSHPGRYGIHLELYANRLVLPVPAGIGVAPPKRRRGAHVLGGACTYPIRSLEPTGVIVVDRGAVPFLGQLFAVWGQPSSEFQLAGFRGPVTAFLDGRRWRGSSAAIPLRPHAEIVLEISGTVLPHPAYRFPPGL